MPNIKDKEISINTIKTNNLVSTKNYTFNNNIIPY